jgi:hypothetical protein
LPEAQSTPDVHVVLHANVPHAYAPHDVLVTVRHTPAPSQVLAGVYVVPRQDSLTQVVPEAHLRHAPEPSHWPSSPQLDAVSCGHSLSGSVPATIARQRPEPWLVLEATHAMQPPVQSDSQQTPSTQWSLPHC